MYLIRDKNYCTVMFEYLDIKYLDEELKLNLFVDENFPMPPFKPRALLLSDLVEEPIVNKKMSKEMADNRVEETVVNDERVDEDTYVHHLGYISDQEEESDESDDDEGSNEEDDEEI